MDFGHLMDEADRLADARQKLPLFEEAGKGAQIAKGGQISKGHGVSCFEKSSAALTGVNVTTKGIWFKAMMSNVLIIPRFPAAGSVALRFAPLTPLSLAGARLVKNLGLRHPSLFVRLGQLAEKTFLIDPTDLPFVFRLAPQPDAPQLEALRRDDAGRWDARIAGPLAALLGMVHGVYDGDALFFSRDLVIEGDTEAVLALRNAIDNEEIDLATEAAALFGPLEFVASAPARRLAVLVGGWSGVALTRPERERPA
jgi:predicted lipid carrier protein YhbT